MMNTAGSGSNSVPASITRAMTMKAEAKRVPRALLVLPVRFTSSLLGRKPPQPTNWNERKTFATFLH